MQSGKDLPSCSHSVPSSHSPAKTESISARNNRKRSRNGSLRRPESTVTNPENLRSSSTSHTNTDTRTLGQEILDSSNFSTSNVEVVTVYEENENQGIVHQADITKSETTVNVGVETIESIDPIEEGTHTSQRRNRNKRNRLMETPQPENSNENDDPQELWTSTFLGQNRQRVDDIVRLSSINDDDDTSVNVWPPSQPREKSNIRNEPMGATSNPPQSEGLNYEQAEHGKGETSRVTYQRSDRYQNIRNEFLEGSTDAPETPNTSYERIRLVRSPKDPHEISCRGSSQTQVPSDRTLSVDQSPNLSATHSEHLSVTHSKSLNASSSNYLDITHSESLNASSSNYLGITHSESLNASSSNYLGITHSESLNASSSKYLGITHSEILGVTHSEFLNASKSKYLGITHSEILSASSSINLEASLSDNSTVSESENLVENQMENLNTNENLYSNENENERGTSNVNMNLENPNRNESADESDTAMDYNEFGYDSDETDLFTEYTPQSENDSDSEFQSEDDYPQEIRDQLRSHNQRRNSTAERGASLIAQVDPNNWLCPICLDSYKGQEVVSTVCGHIFCKTCLERYRQEKTDCPFCREDLSRRSAVSQYSFS